MSIRPSLLASAGMLNHAPLRTHGPGMESDRPLAAGSSWRSWGPCRGQSVVCQCRDLDRPVGRALARSARAVRLVEFRISTVQSLVPVGGLAERVPRAAVARPGSAAARLDGDSHASACRGFSPKKAAQYESSRLT